MSKRRQKLSMWTIGLVSLFVLNFILLLNYGREQKKLQLKFSPGENLVCFEKNSLKRLGAHNRVFRGFAGELGREYHLVSCQRKRERWYPGKTLARVQLIQKIETHFAPKERSQTLCFSVLQRFQSRVWEALQEACYFLKSAAPADL